MSYVLEGEDGNKEKRCTRGSLDQEGKGGRFQQSSKRKDKKEEQRGQCNKNTDALMFWLTG